VSDFASQYETVTRHDGSLQNDWLRTPLKILVAEDNAADRFWLEMVLNSAGIPYTLTPVTDGEAAKAYLLKHVEEESDVPDLVFLDQNLPSLNAMEIVQEIPQLNSLPYCIVTGSDTEKEQWVAEFGLSPHCYIVKPLTQAKLLKFLQAYDQLRPVAEAIEHSSEEPRVASVEAIGP
jgi:CheY-like chemotaxis protein